MKNLNSKLLKTVITAMLCAVAFVVATAPFLRFKPLAAAPFLTYEPKDVIILIGGSILGPIAAIAISVIVAFIEMITVSSSGWIGFFMNVVSSVAFVLPATLIYKKSKNMGSALIGCLIGMIFMTAAMVLWNYILTPIFMGWPRSSIVEMIVPILIPFNLIKSGINSVAFILLSTPIFRALKKSNLLDKFI